MAKFGPYPAPNLSPSSLRTFKTCKRAYFFSVFGSWQGWTKSAKRYKRKSYALKKANSVAGLAGTGVHNAAQVVFSAARKCQPPPTPEELVASTVHWVNAEIVRGRKVSISTATKANPLLLDEFYDEDERDWQPTVEKCVPAIYETDHLPAVMESTHDPVKALEGLASVQLKLDRREVTLWASPDLAYEAPDGSFAIIDWKTGKKRPADSDQMLFYSLFCAESGMAEAERHVLILEYLADGSQRTARSSPKALDRLLEEIAVIDNDICDRLEDVKANKPREDAEAWPQEPRGSRACRWCDFRVLCKR